MFHENISLTNCNIVQKSVRNASVSFLVSYMEFNCKELEMCIPSLALTFLCRRYKSINIYDLKPSCLLYEMKSSRAIDHVKMEIVSNVSEAASVSDERRNLCTVRSEPEIVGSNPTQGVDV
jgi:hypothetical protein